MRKTLGRQYAFAFCGGEQRGGGCETAANGAKVNAKDEDGGRLCIRRDGQQCGGGCETLIDNRADVNAKTKTGWTPLHWAAYKNEAEILLMLIDNGEGQCEKRGRRYAFACGGGARANQRMGIRSD